MHRPLQAATPLLCVDDAAREQALDWFVTLSSGEVSASERADFARWLAACPSHCQAWDGLRGFREMLQGMPGSAAGAALRGGATRPRVGRRQVLGALAALACGAVLYSRRDDLLQLAADERTAVGQQRTLHLPDGSRLVLDTASAVDIRFDGEVRRLILRRGAIMVQTAHSAQWSGQPFVVDTAVGSLRALGTRFTVRQLPGNWWGNPGRVAVAVTAGAVRISPARDPDASLVLGAGRQASFDAAAVATPTSLDINAQAWADGLLIVRDRPLGEFISELARYRSGRLDCDATAARLRVTGVFPLDDSERILDALESALPIKVRRHTRYWVTLVADSKK
ncbi:FecR domain-containing protein [Herbaspirillum sp. alder98]|uniref:FecR domain-containing protein n=1 Tax=Herbaspirillum sp. alder98 TaxID=2913096 RepID=UPI001CD8FA10|nr:FecR family protein [Herbaspirillum sp. alder98]MCA1323602.1 FecR family protein [Herbaspirillum sp. alder98]